MSEIKGTYHQRFKSLKDRFEEKYEMVPECGCWIWMASCGYAGYGHFNGWRAHRLAWELYVGPIPEGMIVLHMCDTPACVNPHHCYLGTQKDNVIDMYKKGRGGQWSVQGERNHKAKFTETTVKNIKADKRSIKEIASEYKVHISTIYRLKNNNLWKHLKE